MSPAFELLLLAINLILVPAIGWMLKAARGKVIDDLKAALLQRNGGHSLMDVQMQQVEQLNQLAEGQKHIVERMDVYEKMTDQRFAKLVVHILRNTLQESSFAAEAKKILDEHAGK